MPPLLSNPPFLYLPIEVSARELDAKLLITCFAVAFGFEVVIGNKWLMQRNIGHMPAGVMLFKTMTTRDAKAMRLAKSHGYATAAIDEEVPGVVARRSKLRWTCEEAVRTCDVIFAQGDDLREALVRRFPDYQDKYVVVGNPRWDLLRPEFVGTYEEDVARIRRDFGRFILVNTNLGFVNSGKGSAEKVIRTLERGGKIDRRRPEDAAYIEDFCRLEQGNFDAIKALLPRLSDEFPDHRIVVRPHPGENMDAWKSALASVPRTELVRIGAAVPWILASEVLVHTTCTTGVEAFALGKPAVSYRPIYVPVIDNYLSPQINFVADKIDDLIGRVRSILAAPQHRFSYPEEFHANFQQSFANATGPFAAERVARHLAPRSGLRPDPALCAKWQPRPGYVRHIATKAHKNRLMPPIDRDQVLGRLHRIQSQTGRQDLLKVDTCGDRMFHIHGHQEIAYTFDQTGRMSWMPAWLARVANAVRGTSEPRQ